MVFWVVLVLVLLVAFQMFEMGKTPQYRISYSEFLSQIDKGNIKKITFKGLEVRGEFAVATNIPLTSATDRSRTRDVKVEQFMLVLPAEDKDLPQRIIARNPSSVIEGQIPGGSTWVRSMSGVRPLPRFVAVIVSATGPPAGATPGAALMVTATSKFAATAQPPAGPPNVALISDAANARPYIVASSISAESPGAGDHGAGPIKMSPA